MSIRIGALACAGLRAPWRVLAALFLTSLPVAGFAGLAISNGQLVDGNGVPFVMRGVAYP
jgi:hypothetical protein